MVSWDCLRRNDVNKTNNYSYLHHQQFTSLTTLILGSEILRAHSYEIEYDVEDGENFEVVIIPYASDGQPSSDEDEINEAESPPGKSAAMTLVKLITSLTNKFFSTQLKAFKLSFNVLIKVCVGVSHLLILRHSYFCLTFRILSGSRGRRRRELGLEVYFILKQE
jgi:hypothetical protein